MLTALHETLKRRNSGVGFEVRKRGWQGIKGLQPDQKPPEQRKGAGSLSKAIPRQEK